MTATGPLLASSSAKLNRAKELAAQLARDVEAFRALEPFEVVRGLDEAASEWVTYAVITAQPPIAWSMILGDCVHNLRSALDHAVFALSVRAAGRELTDDEAREPAFPVCDTEAQWTRATSRELRFLGADAVALVRSAQPLLVPEDARKNWPLRVIADVDNADKHRALLVTASVAGLMGVGLSDAAQRVHRFTGPLAPGGSLVSRVPVTIDPERATEPLWDVHIRLDPAGPVANPIVFNQEVDHLPEGWIRHVDYLLGVLSARDHVQSEVSRG